MAAAVVAGQLPATFGRFAGVMPSEISGKLRVSVGRDKPRPLALADPDGAANAA
ncbi:hypothetical protein ACFQOZ_19800 [Comamonas endophytica]|uniref:hypothetical protein n=1 Tax=Comamonas endophytica TaxID=2949090 RepID=UPI00360A5E3A